jgi:uncharacterized protein
MRDDQAMCDVNASPDRQPARPSDMPIQLCVGRVMHHRLHPRAHRFEHRVFFFRLPLARLEQASNRWFGVNRNRPLSIHFADYGPGDGTPPRDWLDPLLAGAGIESGGDIVLQTFPRLFGYVFNPVSFWYCHDRSGAVRAVVAEVNNTFGERHCYLLAHSDGRALREGETIAARKVLHVSPFFPVRGTYRFRFHWTGGRALACIDYAEVDGTESLRTSVSGIDRDWTPRALAMVLVTHPLMTLAVMVRIHFEALRLWAKGIRFHRKPVPPSTQLTRSEP